VVPRRQKGRRKTSGLLSVTFSGLKKSVKASGGPSNGGFDNNELVSRLIGVGGGCELAGRTDRTSARTHFELGTSQNRVSCLFPCGGRERGGHSALLPSASGTGKSTFAADLAGHGFAYLGDDTIAMTRADWSLRPLPTCLSLKSGSWPILTALYPELPHLPIVLCHGRDVRYVEPRQARYAGSAPSVILFPNYAKSGGTQLRALAPLQTMTRLIETSTDLHRPATGAALAEFLQFVERTPAYELVYRDLPSAKTVIEEWLDNTV
jgi:hypothetical protein